MNYVIRAGQMLTNVDIWQLSDINCCLQILLNISGPDAIKYYLLDACYCLQINRTITAACPAMSILTFAALTAIIMMTKCCTGQAASTDQCGGGWKCHRTYADVPAYVRMGEVEIGFIREVCPLHPTPPAPRHPLGAARAVATSANSSSLWKLSLSVLVDRGQWEWRIFFHSQASLFPDLEAYFLAEVKHQPDV